MENCIKNMDIIGESNDYIENRLLIYFKKQIKKNLI